MTQVDPDNEATYQVVEVPSTLHDAKIPEQRIMADVQACGYSENAMFAIKLALEEAMTNAVKHGNENDHTKRIVVRYAVMPDRVIIIVRDDGPGFLPAGVPDCTSPDRLSVPSGRGIMLMRAYMDEVCYRDRGREVYLMKRSD